MKIIITGGCGFIGHHAVKYFLDNTDWHIYIIDKLSYASNGLNRLRDIDFEGSFTRKRITFFSSDLAVPLSSGIKEEMCDADYILHLAAETHVDNSIRKPADFISSNVVGTFNILEFAKELINIQLKAFVYFSTDEVFGNAPEGVKYKEWDRYDSTSPYSATKAAGEELTLSYMNSYKLPGFIIHCMNCIGERQHPEKFIPKTIKNVLEDRRVLIHGIVQNNRGVSGSRYYIHARHVVDAVYFLLDKFEQREKYNIAGRKEMSNLIVARIISRVLEKQLTYELIDFHESRPGQDFRYDLDGSKLKEMGWEAPEGIENILEDIVRWNILPQNKKWLYI
tara:strand:+ start:8087 stop:9097 length:1011 start_codon:yes stop_codon:yes gene_type:complete